jgi:hypothetical protein
MIKLYCNKCNKEIFVGIMEKFSLFKEYTLEEVEKDCICDECKNKK